MIYLEAKNLTVGYNDKAIINDIDFTLNKGEILTLIGPNGAGKSTILKTVIGELKKLKGEIILDGKEISSWNKNEIAKKIAILMTEKLDPELMTCFDMVATGRYPYTGKLGLLTDSDREIVNDALAKVNGMELKDLYFSEISDGQRQRILLARALCQEPSLIILDEPTSFLDIRYKLELLTILKDLVREKNISVLMSLHEIDLAKRVSDKVLCVAGNRIDKSGTPEEVFNKEYIAKLYNLDIESVDSCFKDLGYV